jgi:hypothetical protein
MMHISPQYEQIKALAVETLFDNLASISRYSLHELRKPKNSFALRNAVGVALIRARDKIEGVQYKHKFNVGNHNKAEREIIKLIKTVEAGAKKPR